MRPLTITLCLLATPALADVSSTTTVIDGDTIEVHGQRIRLHWIDAPESRQLCRRDNKPWRAAKEVRHPRRGKSVANSLEHVETVVL
jgi:endonuclease YncB( thermonuclease family)